LENEGLIDYIPNHGCYAKGFTHQDVDDIYAVREALEKLAVGLAVERITEEELAELEEQCDLMEFYAKKKDPKKVLELNSTFHDTIYAATRSRFMAQVLHSYKEYLDKTRRSIFYEQNYLECIIKEHRAILRAIQSGDKQLASRAVEEHLQQSRMRTETFWNLK
jgi:DNA-binding GntR family transcriptional regulator